MTDDHIFSITFGIVLIYIAIKLLDTTLIWVYNTFKTAGRIAIAICGLAFIQIVTLALFDIEFTEFTWGSIGTAVVLAFLFPNGANNYSW